MTRATSSSCTEIAVRIASASRSHSRDDPSMSVSMKVTTPPGRRDGSGSPRAIRFSLACEATKRDESRFTLPQSVAPVHACGYSPTMRLLLRPPLLAPLHRARRERLAAVVGDRLGSRPLPRLAAAGHDEERRLARLSFVDRRVGRRKDAPRCVRKVVECQGPAPVRDIHHEVHQQLAALERGVDDDVLVQCGLAPEVGERGVYRTPADLERTLGQDALLTRCPGRGFQLASDLTQRTDRNVAGNELDVLREGEDHLSRTARRAEGVVLELLMQVQRGAAELLLVLLAR